ncbi:hypothetical protein ACFX12_009675 [Malus domestica]
MSAANWFTSSPYSVEASISASKWSNFRRGFPLIKDKAWSQWVDEVEPIWKKKWMDNGIYELIMLFKVAVIAKLEFLTTTLIFWNNRTNTFDFRMGPMSLTVLNMAQVFELRPSSSCVDITHNWSSPSCPTAEASSASESITHLDCTPSTFKSYVTSFVGFIPFAK